MAYAFSKEVSLKDPCAASSLSVTRRWVIAVLFLSLTPLVPAGMKMGGREVAAATPPTQDQLAFVSSRDGSIQIYVIRADGTGLHRLTGAVGQSEIPVWSPDGRRIAFVKIRNGDSQIYVMNADGSGQRWLTAAPGINTFPAWSPDGRRILFVSGRQGSPQIYVMKGDGSGQKKLTSPPGESTVPVWSPDGRRIAFVSTRDQGVPEFYVMNADGSKQKRLTKPEPYVANAFSRGEQRLEAGGILLRPGVLHPAWSPDGKRIAFVTRVGRAEQSIQVVNADGSGRARLATGYAPAWSPDGQRVAFVVARVGDAQIYVMNTDGSSLKRLTPLGVNLLPTWSPDGRHIAFLASRDGGLGLYVMNADGSGQQRLADVAGDLSVLPIFSWKPHLRK